MKIKQTKSPPLKSHSHNDRKMKIYIFYIDIDSIFVCIQNDVEH